MYVSLSSIYERIKHYGQNQNWNNSQNTGCKPCNRDDESHEHLFFKCIYSKKIWQVIKQKLKLNHVLNDNLNDGLEYLETGITVKSFVHDIVDVAVSTTVWHIRIE